LQKSGIVISMRLITTAFLAALLPALASAPLSAAPTTFRCQDAKGKWYYGDKLPPECAKGPSSELDKSGVKIKENQGELTPEQRAAEKEKQRLIEEEKNRVVECRRKVKSLAITYNSVEEIDAARQKTLKQAEDSIQGIRQKIADIQTLQADLQKRIAEYKNKKVPADLRESAETADTDLRKNQDQIIAKRKELDSIRAKFDAEKKLYLDMSSPNPSEDVTCEPRSPAK
jgi:DNA repair exonuclease SbcCD ATPase subunit